MENKKTKPKKRRYLFDPLSDKAFKISRSKLELFIKCPRCFYLSYKLGIKRPPGYPFTLNKAVDVLLKKEFDVYRDKQKPHHICIENEIEAIPFEHENIETWRNVRRGIDYDMPKTNIKITGAIDDIWINKKTNELIIIEYKTTAKKTPVTIDAEWQESYKRQIEVYQWLFRKNGFKVSDLSYFVYCNGNKEAEKFDKKLEFYISIIPYTGNDSWVEETIINAHKCLLNKMPPPTTEDCNYCNYGEEVIELNSIEKKVPVMSKAIPAKTKAVPNIVETATSIENNKWFQFIKLILLKLKNNLNNT